MLDRNNAAGGLLDIRRRAAGKIQLIQIFANVLSQINFVVTSQRNKWFLSSVIFFGLGCGGYFLLPARVGLTQVALPVILLCCGFWLSRRLAVLAFGLAVPETSFAASMEEADSVHVTLAQASGEEAVNDPLESMNRAFFAFNERESRCALAFTEGVNRSRSDCRCYSWRSG